MRHGGASLRDIERIYRTRLPAFVRAAAIVTGDSDSARDAVQEAFAGAIRKRAAFRGDGPLEAWIWRWVVNAARDHRRPAEVPLHAIAEPATGGHADGVARRASLLAALGRHTERQRLVILLRHFGDLDYAAIAVALEIAPSTVGPALAQARAALRLELEEATR